MNDAELEELTTWPSIGGECVQWIEDNLVHGPGDVRGQPAKVRPDVELFLWRIYEVFPPGHQRAGRRRYQRGVFSRIKGTAKSELGAWLVLLELLGPVRCDGFDAYGQPVGRPIDSAYIPVAATSEDQAEDTLWGAVYAIAVESPLADFLDIGVDRIIEPATRGEAKMVTSSSVSRDGGKPTFTAEDETHLFVSAELRRLDNVLQRNLAKRREADPWSYAGTTMFAAGEQSVAEHDYDLAVAGTKWLLHDHLEAGPGHDLTTDEGLIAAIAEAAGDARTFLDLGRIAQDYRRDPKEGERYWLNRRRGAANRAIEPDEWDACRRPDAEPLRARDKITLAFDGSLGDDWTVLVACRISDGFTVPLGWWHRPDDLAETAQWDLPRTEVLNLVDETFAKYKVIRYYVDPPHWGDELAAWKAAYGAKTVVDFWTQQDARMARATHRWKTAVAHQHLGHDGNPYFRTHVLNAVRRSTRVRLDDDGRFLWVLSKDRHDSPRKIDLAVGSVLAWEARTDVIATGEHKRRETSRRMGTRSRY